jgi:hypothetical protein
MPVTLLPQHLGYKPGTSLVGSFSVLAPRFPVKAQDRLLPGPADYSPQDLGAGPSAHSPRGPRPAFLTSEPRQKITLPSTTPGPGAVDEVVPGGDIATRMQRRWAGVPQRNFGVAKRSMHQSLGDGPGPGTYDRETSERFMSRCGAARSPYLADARAAAGSTISRSCDSNASAVFVPASHGATRYASRAGFADRAGRPTAVSPPSAPGPSPGPGHYEQATVVTRAREQHERADALRSHGSAFASSERRFQLRPSPGGTLNAHAGEGPSPAAYRPPRYSGLKPSQRRPRSETGAGFISSAPRTMSAGGVNIHRAPLARPPSPRQLAAFLASSDTVPVGTQRHRQAVVSLLQQELSVSVF